VLAVGSNAAPAHLLRKFEPRGVFCVVPMTKARVAGLRPGVSAHISVAGYVAATPVLARGEETALTVCWLDDAQLDALDDTERNYRRVLLPGDRFPVVLPSAEQLGACSAYVSRHGCLLNGGSARPLGPQPELLADLLSRSAALRAVFGDSPEEMSARAAAGEEAREEGRRLFAAEGWVGAQPELEALGAPPSPAF
jgi:hypothetical protein